MPEEPMKLLHVASCNEEGWIEVLINNAIYKYEADGAVIHRFREMLLNPYCKKGKALSYLKAKATKCERR